MAFVSRVNDFFSKFIDRNYYTVISTSINSYKKTIEVSIFSSIRILLISLTSLISNFCLSLTNFYATSQSLHEDSLSLRWSITIFKLHFGWSVNNYKKSFSMFNFKKISFDDFSSYVWKKWRKKVITYRSSRPEVFLRKGVLKICCKFTGGHPYRSAISIKLHSKLLKQLKESLYLFIPHRVWSR